MGNCLLGGGHSDPVIENDRVLLASNNSSNLNTGGSSPARNCSNFRLFQSVGGIWDQLSNEDLLVGVERLGHNVQQFPRLGLELVLLGSRSGLLCKSRWSYQGALEPARVKIGADRWIAATYSLEINPFWAKSFFSCHTRVIIFFRIKVRWRHKPEYDGFRISLKIEQPFRTGFGCRECV